MRAQTSGAVKPRASGSRRRDHGDRRLPGRPCRRISHQPAETSSLGEIDGDRVVPVLAQLGRDEDANPTMSHRLRG